MYFLTQPYLGFTETLAVSQASTATDLQLMGKVSYQITQSAASPSFTATIQVSNDGVNWIDTTATTTITGAGSKLLEKVDVCAKLVRLNLVRTSGSLTGLSVVMNAKF